MADLISKDLAMRALASSNGDFLLAMDKLENIPAVDAVPVVHGKWVGYPDRLRHWHCSECGSVWGITAKVMYYCPNCGSKMEMPDEWRKDIEA